MQIKQLLLAAAFTGITFTTVWSQETDITIEKPNTIDNQFNDMVEGANNFQDFKLIKKTAVDKLQKNTSDSLKALKTSINTINTELESERSTIASLKSSLSTTKETLGTAKEEISSIDFLGIPTNKAAYKVIMWSLVGILAVTLAFFVVRYRGSNGQIQTANRKYAEVEVEYQEYRKKALEKEQRLGRQLQDERNKVNRS